MRDSRRTVNDSYLLTLLVSSFLSFRKTRLAARYWRAVIFPPPPFCLPVFFDLFIPGSTPPVRSVFRHPRPFIFSPPLLPSAGPLTNPLGSAPSRIPWEVSSREFFGKSPLANPLGNLCSRILWEIASHGSFGKRPLTNPLALYYHSGHGVLSPLSLSPLGLAKRVADVRSPERACRSEPELVSEAAKRAGASLGGRSTTTYRTIDARLPSDCERLLFINSHSSFLSLFRKTRLAAR